MYANRTPFNKPLLSLAALLSLSQLVLWLYWGNTCKFMDLITILIATENLAGILAVWRMTAWLGGTILVSFLKGRFKWCYSLRSLGWKEPNWQPCSFQGGYWKMWPDLPLVSPEGYLSVDVVSIQLWTEGQGYHKRALIQYGIKISLHLH